jgi:predicted O-methyltransferase YrrM
MSSDAQDLWTAVDDYLNRATMQPDSTLDAALVASTAAGLPTIQVAPNQGKLLHLIARVARAKHILEIGTLGGYSTIWLARALPADGRLVTLEVDPMHAQVARGNIERAGLAGRVELRLAPALETLPKLAAENRPRFDIVFIDANKEQTTEYFEWAMKLTHPGSLIIVDNVVRAGKVIDPNADGDAQGIRRFFERLATEPRVSATALQTVGSKGYDGLAVMLVTEDGGRRPEGGRLRD